MKSHSGVKFDILLLGTIYRKYYYSLLCWELDEKTDATLMCAQNDEATGSNQKLAIG